MDSEKIEQLKQEIEKLKVQLKERESSMPAHSAPPSLMMQMEEMEEEIEEKEKLLKRLEDSR